MEELSQAVDSLSGYGGVILHSLYFLLTGILIIVALQYLAVKYLYPRMNRPRIMKVFFGSLYFMVLVLAVLLALKDLGYNIEGIGPIAVFIVLVGAVISFFLLPFFPSLPFKIGDWVEANNVFGMVETITPFHTRLNTPDGKTVFIPNTVVFYAKIINFTATPSRRVTLRAWFSHNADMKCANELLLEVMNGNEKVLDDPAPAVLAIDLTADRIELNGYCWTPNEYWRLVRSQLYQALVERLQQDDDFGMALTKQEVLLDQKELPGSG